MATNTASTPADRQLDQRLYRVLTLAERPGSDGERDAAVQAAARLLCRDPGYWRRRLAPEPEPALQTRPPPQRPPRAPWRWLVEACLANQALLNRWERDFLHSLWVSHEPSPKQLAVLHEIAAKIGVLGAAP